MNHKRKLIYVVIEDMTDVKQDFEPPLPLPNTVVLGAFEDRKEAQKLIDAIPHGEYCSIHSTNLIYDVL